ncbi:hypothetical protein BOO71_0006544 [Deinococcus marmoris]|uniref:Uncharacterized protein n=1 Tax=Deinococcus marmoris TaxID=249408 RepID=A0A1U7NZ17_9DEIO|nr:hypothetical protein BOO71_0006544 [Deinococcus marmoris]
MPAVPSSLLGVLKISNHLYKCRRVAQDEADSEGSKKTAGQRK